MFSIGAQWAVLQSAAWVRMAVSYSIKAGSVADGLSQTFDGEHPCAMCLAIAKGKQSEKKDPAVDATKLKQDLIASGGTIITFATPAAVYFPRAANETAPARRIIPPVPPPRWGDAQL